MEHNGFTGSKDLSNRKPDMTAHDIGQTIGFTTPAGEYKQGVITGRDWSGSILLFYTVQAARGQRYHVNAADFKSGHTF